MFSHFVNMTIIELPLCRCLFCVCIFACNYCFME